MSEWGDILKECQRESLRICEKEGLNAGVYGVFHMTRALVKRIKSKKIVLKRKVK